MILEVNVVSLRSFRNNASYHSTLVNKSHKSQNSVKHSFKIETTVSRFYGSGGLVVKVSASQPRDHEFVDYSGHDHVSSYCTSTGWLDSVCYKLQEIVSQSSLNKYV
jgi:hypothetical protein